MSDAIRSMFSSSRRRRAANSKSRIANLDPRLLRKIFEQVSLFKGCSQWEIAQMCYICRAWVRPAQLILYQRVWAKSLRSAITLHTTLTRDKDLRDGVKYFELPPVWFGASRGGGWTMANLRDQNSPNDWMSSYQFYEYLLTMRRCALLLPQLEEVRTSADIKCLQQPAHSPRIDWFLDLPNTHTFLRRLHLDDGGLHKSTIQDIFPENIKFNHLEELTLQNYAFAPPPRLRLLQGSPAYDAEFNAKLDRIPRLKSLRLIHCTSADNALLPLTREVARSVESLTIVQTKTKYSCSPDGDGDRWHSAFAHNDVFAPLSRRILHLSLSMEFYRPSYFLSYSKLVALHLRARKFHRAGVMDLPTSIRHLSITITDTDPDWAQFDHNDHDVFNDLEDILAEVSLLNRIPYLRILDLSFTPSLKESVKYWAKLSRIQKLCRHGRVLLRIRMDASLEPWGEQLDESGRAVAEIMIASANAPSSHPVPAREAISATEIPPPPARSTLRKIFRRKRVQSTT